jgi:hypothetical protein
MSIEPHVHVATRANSIGWSEHLERRSAPRRRNHDSRDEIDSHGAAPAHPCLDSLKLDAHSVARGRRIESGRAVLSIHLARTEQQRHRCTRSESSSATALATPVAGPMS